METYLRSVRFRHRIGHFAPPASRFALPSILKVLFDDFWGGVNEELVRLAPEWHHDGPLQSQEGSSQEGERLFKVASRDT
jgi:hypothetical protein